MKDSIHCGKRQMKLCRNLRIIFCVCPVTVGRIKVELLHKSDFGTRNVLPKLNRATSISVIRNQKGDQWVPQALIEWRESLFEIYTDSKVDESLECHGGAVIVRP